MATMYPTGYRTDELTIGALFVRHHGEKMHPEFRRRLRAWLEAQPDGRLGIGSGFRTTQPVKPGFAAPGKSFHQLQTFRSGISAYSAVDLVCRIPGSTHSSGAIPLKWVPLQGGTEAKRWGLHVNVGTPGKAGFEVWHLQPVEYDGWDSWVTNDRPDPVAGYPLPTDPPPAPPPPVLPEPPSVPNFPDDEEEEVAKLLCRAKSGRMYCTDLITYANYCTEEEGVNLRDQRGAGVAPDGGPWPLNSTESAYVERMADR